MHFYRVVFILQLAFSSAYNTVHTNKVHKSIPIYAHQGDLRCWVENDLKEGTDDRKASPDVKIPQNVKKAKGDICLTELAFLPFPANAYFGKNV